MKMIHPPKLLRKDIQESGRIALGLKFFTMKSIIYTARAADVHGRPGPGGISELEKNLLPKY
jgi:hypothetical protein